MYPLQVVAPNRSRESRPEAKPLVGPSDGPPWGRSEATGGRFTLALVRRLQEWARRYGYEQAHPLGLILIRLANHTEIERLMGRDAAGRLMAAVAEAIRHVFKSHLTEADLDLVEQRRDGETLWVFHCPGLEPDRVRRLAENLPSAVKALFGAEVWPLVERLAGFEVGQALTRGLTPEALEVTLQEAEEAARLGLDPSQQALAEEFETILSRGLIYPLYQPIFNLSAGAILGWEALSRGPEGSPLHTPQALFSLAEKLGSLFALEKVCRTKAIGQAGELKPKQKLFLNINPRALADPEFHPGQTMSLLEAAGLKANQVVFEITEGQRIQDMELFTRTLEHYRSQGYQVAMDDVGAGYSGLKRIARLRPDWIKVDLSLVQGVESNPIQRAILETLVIFAGKIGCGLIAEGIEAEADLTCLRHMGVPFGQGYCLARPARPRPEPKIDLPPLPRSGGGVLGKDLKVSLPVKDLVQAPVCVGPEQTCGQVRALMESSEPIGGVVVVEDGRPVGLVMSHNLDRHLGTLYGVSLYFNRPIKRLMDAQPLIVDGNTAVEVVAERAAARERGKLYDHIIITDQGLVKGVVSVQKVLDVLAKVQVEMARGANPLTGLPGNVAIEMELGRLIAAGQTASLIYADLDNFKVFNDAYGFDKGDQMILLLAKVMTWAIKRHGEPGDFLGHVGGDDFVAMTSPERAERVCQGIIRVFGRLVKKLYSTEDLSRGYVMGLSRQGEPARFPLATVSLAIVDCAGAEELRQVGLRAAEMKKYAKTIPGNCSVRDRRRSKAA